MAYIIKARYYSEPDNFGESYIITSDNAKTDTRLEVGTTITINTDKEARCCPSCMYWFKHKFKFCPDCGHATFGDWLGKTSEKGMKKWEKYNV